MQWLNQTKHRRPSFPSELSQGRLSRGRGTGDPGLLTVKARDLLASCDLLVYDYLVNPEILQQVPQHAERIYAGKVGGGRQTSQAEINACSLATR